GNATRCEIPRTSRILGRRDFNQPAPARLTNGRDCGQAPRDRIKNRSRPGPRIQSRTIAPPAWRGRGRLRHGSWSRASVFRSDQGAHRWRGEVIKGRRSAAGGKSWMYFRQIALAFSTKILEDRELI